MIFRVQLANIHFCDELLPSFFDNEKTGFNPKNELNRKMDRRRCFIE
jgi:hypothetical protein